ncbi:hypothetical protein BDAG_04759 [Burkholderia dolosa AU0158]|nr:hypothetical protein BDAG_04759 [Burkholderia dolosa AU0158]
MSGRRAAARRSAGGPRACGTRRRRARRHARRSRAAAFSRRVPASRDVRAARRAAGRGARGRAHRAVASARRAAEVPDVDARDGRARHRRRPVTCARRRAADGRLAQLVAERAVGPAAARAAELHRARDRGARGDRTRRTGGAMNDANDKPVALPCYPG